MINQRDPRWANLKINNTSYTVGGFGCFLCCVCQVAGIEPPEGLQKLKFDGANLIWESISNIGLEPLEKTNIYDNDKVKQYIAENGQCIVRVDFDGTPRTDDTHFVIYTGNQQLQDPWTGTTRPTSTYPLATGIRACRKIGMGTDEIAVKKTDFERLVSKSSMLDDILAKYQVPDAQGLYNYVAGLLARQTDLTNQLGTAQAEVKNKDEIIQHLKDEIAIKSDDINTLTGRLDQCANTVAQLGKDKGTLAIQVEQLKVQLETAKQGQITLTIGDVIALILKQKITISRK